MKRAFDPYPKTAEVFEKYEKKRHINKLEKEYDLMMYNVVMNFLDTSTQKMVKHM